MESIEDGLRRILIDDLFVEAPAERILPTLSLRGDIGVDSLGFIELKTQIEQRFDVTISDEEFTPENFATLASLTGLIERQRGAG